VCRTSWQHSHQRRVVLADHPRTSSDSYQQCVASYVVLPSNYMKGQKLGSNEQGWLHICPDRFWTSLWCTTDGTIDISQEELQMGLHWVTDLWHRTKTGHHATLEIPVMGSGGLSCQIGCLEGRQASGLCTMSLFYLVKMILMTCCLRKNLSAFWSHWPC